MSAVIGIALATSAALAVPAGAMPPINGVGTLVCQVTATVKYKPALSGVPGHTVVPTTITLKSSLTNCTGTGDGAHVVSGKSTASRVSSTNDCTAVLTAPATTSQGPLKWKTASGFPKLTTSTIQFTGGSSSTGPPITQDSTGSSIGGSFNGDSAVAHAVLQETLDTITADCGGKHGLKELHIIQPGSTFTLSSGGGTD